MKLYHHHIEVENCTLRRINIWFLFFFVATCCTACLFLDKEAKQPELNTVEILFFNELEAKYPLYKASREINDRHLRHPEIPGEYWIMLEKRCSGKPNFDTCYVHAKVISQMAYDMSLKDWNDFEKITTVFICNFGNDTYNQRAYTFLITQGVLEYQP